MSSHMGFVVAAYAASFLVTAGLIGWTILDGRSLRRELDEIGESHREER